MHVSAHSPYEIIWCYENSGGGGGGGGAVDVFSVESRMLVDMPSIYKLYIMRFPSLFG